MAEKFYVKTSPSGWNQITNFFVKTAANSWSTVSDAYVKVSSSLWQLFYSSPMSPSQQVELEYFFYGTNTDSYRLQGTNYKWSPTPQSLKYYFRHVVDNTTTYYIGPGGSSGTVTSNPATSTKLPGVSTYVNIDPAGSNYSLGVLNSYNFEVRATGASGTVYPSISAPFEFRSPKAPTLSFQANTSTSVTLTITASSQNDYYATGRYILYTYDGTSGYVYSGGGRGGFSPTSSSMTKSLTGLVSGRNYVVYVLPITGTTGTTPSNYSGYPGIEASLSGVTTGTAAATSPTSITAANNGSYTTVSISWSGASNAVYYRVRWVGYQDTSVDPAIYYDKQITASSSTSGSWNWGPSDPDIQNLSPYPGTAYYYHVSSSADGTTWSPYTVSATAVGTLAVPAPTIISGYEPVNTNTSGTRNFSVTTGSWNNSPTTYSYQWKAFTYLPYPPYTSTVNVGTNSSSYSGISTYDNYSIYCVVTATNSGGDGTATSNSITQVSPGVAPSGGGVTLTPSGTQQAGTTISANVTAMSGTAPITYVTTIRKATGTTPTGSATAVASGSGTGNGVASHTITDSEASGTPDQFKAYTVGTNAYGDFTVGSNTVVSTPYVPLQYTISWNGNGGTVSPTSQLVNSGTTVSAPTPTRSGYTFLYWRDSPSAFSYIYQINPGGSWTVTSNIQFYAYWQVVSVAPSTPTGVTVSGSGVVSWNAASGADYYEVLNYTDRTGSPSNTNNRLGPYNTTVYGTSLQLGSSQGYSSPNNWARAQVRAWNNAGQVSTYSAWYPSSTTYV
jgi:hypothetical protein